MSDQLRAQCMTSIGTNPKSRPWSISERSVGMPRFNARAGDVDSVGFARPGSMQTARLKVDADLWNQRGMRPDRVIDPPIGHAMCP